jgi:hypothetical protein
MLSLHAGQVCLRDVDIMIENIILVMNDLRRECRNRDWGEIYGKWKIESRKSKVKGKYILMFFAAA